MNSLVAPFMTSRDKHMSPVQDGEGLKERYECRTPHYALTRCLSLSHASTAWYIHWHLQFRLCHQSIPVPFSLIRPVLTRAHGAYLNNALVPHLVTFSLTD